MDRQKNIRLACGIFFAAALVAPAMAQSPENSQPQDAATSQPENKAKPKPKKVWTEDTIGEVRSPADKYSDAKEAGEKTTGNNITTVEPVKSRKPAIGGPPLVLKIPPTAAETQEAIDKRRALSENFQHLLSNAQERLETENDPQVRATLEEKARLLKFDIGSTNADIKTLEKALKDYAAGKTPRQPKEGDPAPSEDKPTEPASPQPPTTEPATTEPATQESAKPNPAPTPAP